MPRLTTLVLGFIIVVICGSLFAANTQPMVQSFNKMPLAFTKNMGQWDDRVLFRANAGGATLWFTKEGVTYQFTRSIPSPPSPLPVGEGWSKTGERADPFDRFDNTRDTIEQLVLTAKFLGANANPEVIAEGQMEYKCNYFIGNDPAKWHTDVPNYQAIILKDIYPNIDLKYSGDGNGRAAYEFIGAPGADIAQVKVAYEGAEETSIDANGRMILKTKWGDMIAAIKTPTNGDLYGPASFSQLSEKAIGFEAAGSNQQALGTASVGLVYSTYLGGGSGDEGHGIAVDGSGSAYVTGNTYSSNFPTLNPYQTFQGSSDVFVSKLSINGNSLVYSTYLGDAGGNDYGYAIAVDGGGKAYVTGRTWSNEFPTQNSYQAAFQGGWDAFVTKLSSSGNTLIYSTYLGGGNDDCGYGIAVDGGGNAYVTGFAGPNFPTLNPYQTYQGSNDVFVTKLSSFGSSLIYSTYLGGGNGDEGHGIAVDNSGYAYVTGGTGSSNFPTLSPYQMDQGGDDVFVTKLSVSGDSLIYSTYLGGGDGDNGWGIAVDDSGSAYVTGYTRSSNFPLQNPLQGSFSGGSDVFVTKLSGSGSNLIYSTYIGEGNYDYGYAIAVNGNGNAYVTGCTQSSDFPTLDAYQTDQEGDDAFVTKLSSSGARLIYSTYLGGSGGEMDYGLGGIAIDGNGNAYVTGYTNSPDFPTTPGAYFTTYNGNYDAFVTKLSWVLDYLYGDADNDGSITIADAVYLIGYIFSGGPAPSPLAAGDTDCSGHINIADVVYLINYIFSHGPAPCAGSK